MLSINHISLQIFDFLRENDKIYLSIHKIVALGWVIESIPNMKDLANFKVNPLYTHVVDDLLDDCQEQGKETQEENLMAWLEYIQEHGLSGRAVTSMIYCDDTTKFFNDYKAQINELLADVLANLCLASVNDLFDDIWDTNDPLILEANNQNLLAWLAYEEVARRLQNYLEEENP